MFKSVFLVSLLTLISRISGFARDIVIASFLGASKLADIFFIAYKLPNFFRSIFGEGAFNSAFVPIFTDELNRDVSQAKRFASHIFGGLLFGLLVFTLCMEIFMPWVIQFTAPGVSNNPDAFSLTISLARIMFIYLILVCVVAFLTAILNSLGKFAPGAAVSIIFNLTTVMAGIFIGHINFNVAYFLAYIVLLGGVLEVIWMLYFLHKHHFMITPTKCVKTERTRLFFHNFIPGVFSACGMQVNNLVDTIIASLFAGAVSYLYYASRLYQVPIALIGTAISVVILPKFSQIFAANDTEAIYRMQKLAILFTLFLVIPSAVTLYLASDNIVIALFQRGRFSMADAMKTAQVLRIYCFTLPCFSLMRILNVQFFARKNTRTPMYISLFTLACNIILSICLMYPYQYLGIVLATAISSLLSLLITAICLYRQHILLFKPSELGKYCSYGIIPTLACGVVLLSMSKWLFNPTASSISRLLTLGLILSSAAITYLILSLPFIPARYWHLSAWRRPTLTPTEKS